MDCGDRRIGRRPDVGALEVRAALIGVAGPLDDRQAAGVEDRAQIGQSRVEPKAIAGAVGADLEHAGGGNRQVGTAREVLRIAVGHDAC